MLKTTTQGKISIQPITGRSLFSYVWVGIRLIMRYALDNYNYVFLTVLYKWAKEIYAHLSDE